MRKLILLNREEIDIWIDPRLSNGDSPFEDLPTLEGFPGIIKAKEAISIDIFDFSELLYLRARAHAPEQMLGLYRVGLPIDRIEVNGNIWPLPTINHPTMVNQTDE